MKYEQARAIADQWAVRLTHSCKRVDIVGSLRRECAEVGDIDIICEPFITEEKDMFGLPTGREINLLEFDFHQVVNLAVDSGLTVLMDGGRRKSLLLSQGIKLELWITLPPSQWGIQKVIRTGPADFSHWMVTPREKGGALPPGMKVKDLCLWYQDKVLETPEEADFFRFLGLLYKEPKERTARWRPNGSHR